MALPSTNITMSAVNTTLGNTSTASLSLSALPVRSLGGSFATSGASAISSLASQSGVWIDRIDQSTTSTLTGYVAGGMAIPSTDQNAVYTVNGLNGNTGGSNVLVCRKFSRNGALQSAVYYSSSSGFFPGEVACGPLSTSNFVAQYTVTKPNIASFTSGNVLSASNGFALSTSGFQSYGQVAVAADGSVYVGASDSSNNVYIVKLTSALAVSWQRVINMGPSTAYVVRAMVTDDSGNLYATVTSSAVSSFYVYNSSGTLLRSRSFAVTGYQLPWLSGLAVKSNGYAAIGSSPFTSITDATLFYLDNANTLQWARNLTYNYIVGGVKTAFAPNGDIFIVTGSQESATALACVVISKFNASGTLLWSRRLRRTTTNYAAQAAQLRSIQVVGSSGNLVVQYAEGMSDEYDELRSFVMFCVPGDGSGTGTYTVNSVTYVYETFTPTVTTPTVTNPTTNASSTSTAFSVTTADSLTVTTAPTNVFGKVDI